MSAIVSFIRLASLLSLCEVGAVTPPTQTPCATLKVNYGKTGCVQLSVDLAYYMLYEPLDPSVTTDASDFTFTLLLQSPTTFYQGSSSKWLGLGIGLNGGMKGADFVMLTKANATSWTLTDRYSDDYARPFEDKSQDYALVSQTETASKIEFTISRKVNTCDFFDTKLNQAEPNFCLWAHGTARTDKRHSMHAGESSRGSVMCDFWVRSAVGGAGLNAGTTDYAIKAHHGSDPNDKAYVRTDHLIKSVSVENQYITSFLSTKQIFHDSGADETQPVRYVTRIEPLIDNKALLHHIILYSCPELTPETMPSTIYDVLMIDGCLALIAWAVGSNGIQFPENVAFKLGERETVLALNMHYYNPSMVANARDASGFTISALPRGVKTDTESDMWLFGELFFQGLIGSKMHPQYSYAHYCPATCVEDMMEAKEVTVMQLGYHGHFDTRRSEAGLMVLENSVFDPALNSSSSSSGPTGAFSPSGGQQVDPSQYMKSLQPGPLHLYDYNHQRIVESSLKIQKGVHGTYVKCRWDFSNRHYAMSYGDGSNDEMCFALWQYYPRQPGLGDGTCSFNLDDRSWIGDYRAKASTYCDTHCEKKMPTVGGGGVTNNDGGYYVKKTSGLPAGTDLFSAQTAPFSIYGGKLETRTKSILISEMEAGCATCSATQRLWSTQVPCTTCHAQNVTTDCGVLVYKGYCPASILPSDASYISDANTRATAVSTFAQNYYADEETKLCSHYCAIGKEAKSLVSCVRGGRYAWSPPPRASFGVRVPSQTLAGGGQCPASGVPDESDQCQAHSDCLSYEYCADTKTWHPETAAWTSGSIQNRKMCRSCSECCKRVDAVDHACPSHCLCPVAPKTCYAEGTDHMLCSAYGLNDAANGVYNSLLNNNGAVVPSTCVNIASVTVTTTASSSGSTSNTSASTSMLATKLAAACPSLCTQFPAGSYVRLDTESRVCEPCIDFDDVYSKRMTNYMDQFLPESMRTLLKPYTCARAEHILAIMKPFNPFIHVSLERHAHALCRYSLRSQLCTRQEGQILGSSGSGSSGDSSSSGAVRAYSTSSGRILLSSAIGTVLGLVLLLDLVAGGRT
ncbi:unnamed protein product [Amoebophrya sp. A25]|nr:unnamed protein product [Amoebophrya sp. A25]|eukprot:GSA25T00026076001.1